MTRLLTIAGLSLLASSALAQAAVAQTGTATQNQTAEALTAEILACNAKQDPACVVNLSTKGISLYPADWTFHFLRGAGLLDLKRFDDAIAEHTTAIAMNSKYAQTFYLRASAYDGVHEYDMALADVRKALEMQPDNAGAKKFFESLVTNMPKGPPTPDGLHKSISECSKAKNYECSVHLGTKGIALAPSDARFYYERGEALGNMAKYSESLVDLSKALDLNPKFQDALTLRAITNELAGNYHAAISDYRAWTSNEPTAVNYVIMAKAVNRMAIEKMKCGVATAAANKSDCAAVLNDAVDAITTAMTHNPGTLTFVALGERMTSYRALTAVGIDRTKEAKADEDRSLQNLDSTATRVNAKLDDVLKAKTAILEIVKQMAASMAKQDYSGVMQLANAGLKQYPDNFNLLYWRGSAYAAQRDYVAAIADFTKAINGNPQYEAALNSRGVAYYNINDFDTAIADFRKALELKPDDATAKANLEAALAKKSR